MPSARLLLLATLAASASCGPRGPRGPRGGADDRPVTLEVWSHAGQESERATLEAQVGRFEAEHDSVRVELVFLPEDSYNGQVQASAVADELPDLLELDGPFVATYAWQGRLRPLAPFLADTLLTDVLPSVVEQGRWDGTLWALGTFDSGVGLYARRSALDAAGVRVPDGPADAWSAREFDDALARLAAADDDGAVLDLKLNYQGEWFTYAFQPLLRSAGGGLVEREGVPRAVGTLDGAASVAALERVQSWITGGRVDPDLDDAAFTSGRVALSLSGHWDWPRYAKAWGDDLVVLPLPDFGGANGAPNGRGMRSGQGSWVWSLPRASAHPEAAAALLAFLLRPDEILAMTGANGAVPATRTAAARSERYGPEGPLHLFYRQLEGGWTVPRPRTPAYPVITSLFQAAFDAVRNGEDVAAVLHDAAVGIDREVRDNEGYPPT